ncbi:hypothetical protein A0H81_11417 [Grifola frondosa]|uniref:Uncharacterized protein n=1 Tax=Grifola frondosa TaxID=5627 RepID=A0A1C7LUN6_GRIFR|nr:hypothetical protein A0H81_11417 [Grifola frondosa]
MQSPRTPTAFPVNEVFFSARVTRMVVHLMQGLYSEYLARVPVPERTAAVSRITENVQLLLHSAERMEVLVGMMNFEGELDGDAETEKLYPVDENDMHAEVGSTSTQSSPHEGGMETDAVSPQSQTTGFASNPKKSRTSLPSQPWSLRRTTLLRAAKQHPPPRIPVRIISPTT